MTFVKEEIATLKEQGIVKDAPSDTIWAAPIVVVKKADGGWRLCTDFRKLNSVTAVSYTHLTLPTNREV